MLERDKDGDGISIYFLFTYVIMPGAMTLIAGQKSALIMFWQKMLRGCLVRCDMPLMWCTLQWCDIKIFALFYFF